MFKRNYFKKTREDAEKTKSDINKESKAYYDAVKNFEQNEIDTVRFKSKLLLRFCVAEASVIVLLAGAIMSLAPLKTAVPFVIRVDNTTGYTDIAPELTNAKESYQERETKFFLKQFVINYESYDWQTIQQMLDTVKLMSNSNVFSQYNTAIRAPSSPLNVLKDAYKIKVKIKSITMLKPDIAQVRFSKMVLNSSGNIAPEYKVTDWIATIAFDFNQHIETEEDSMINPLGMQVLSYRVDAEAVK